MIKYFDIFAGIGRFRSGMEEGKSEQIQICLRVRCLLRDRPICKESIRNNVRYKKRGVLR